MLDVCLLGTSGMMPLPGRWLTSLMTRYNGSSLIIDCGEGTQVAIKECGWSPKPIDTMLITHFHADHISGLPGLLLTMGNAERTEPLTIVGPRGVERVVNSLRVVAPELPFEIKFKELSQDEECFELNGYHITAFRVKHNVVCYGYTLEIPRAGRFQVEKAKKVFTSLADAFPEGQKVCTTMFKLAAIYSTEGNIDMQKQYLQKILNSKTCSTSGEFEQAAEILQEILEQETQAGPKAAEPSNGPEAAAPTAETPAADAQPAAPAPAP